MRLQFQEPESWSFLCHCFDFLPTTLTKHQAFAPSGPILFFCRSSFLRVEFSLRPSAKAWQEKADGTSSPALLIKLSIFSVFPSQESLQPRDKGMKHKKTSIIKLCQTQFGVFHSQVISTITSIAVFETGQKTYIYLYYLYLYHHWSSRTHQLALTMSIAFWPRWILKVFRVFVSARYSARALQSDSNPVWKGCSESKLWMLGDPEQHVIQQ